MSNLFDRILKENIAAVFPSLSKKLLGIEITHSEELKDKLQRTNEREADFLRKVVASNGEEFVIHLEFQTTDEKEMLNRMQLYHALVKQKYGLPIRQFVIYIGEKPPNMPTQFQPEDVYWGFNLIELRQVSYQELLNSDIREEVVLAILGDFENEKQEIVVQKILAHLKQLNTSPDTLNKYIHHLLTFARLRDLTNITEKQLESMGIVYDIEQDAFFKRGEKRGIEIGEKKGIEIGEKKGIEIGEKKGIEIGEKKGIKIGEKKATEKAKTEAAQKARQVVLNLYNTNKLSLEEIAQAAELSLEEVKKIVQEIK